MIILLIILFGVTKYERKICFNINNTFINMYFQINLSCKVYLCGTKLNGFR